MAKPQDFFGSSTKSVLTRPFFHVQDQKAYNVDGGGSVADTWTKRVLNTVLYNDIQGASLGTNEVNLPAGTYYVEALGPMRDNIGSSFIIALFKDGVKVLQSISGFGRTDAAGITNLCASGVVTLSTPGVVDIRYYAGVVMPTSGLGVSNNSGSVTDPTIPSIYSELKIWQLDRSLEIAPKAINSGLQTIAGMNTEGGIMGGDASVSGNTVTITKCSCMSSDLTTAMALTVDTAVALPSTVSQDFYIFVVRLVADGTFTVRAYTTYAGPSSDGTVDKWRFVSYAKNDGSGVTMPYRQKGSRISFLGATVPVITASLTTSFVGYSVDTVVPSAYFLSMSISVTSTGCQLSISYDGTNDIIGGVFAQYSLIQIDCVSTIYFKYANNNSPVKIRDLELRR